MVRSLLWILSSLDFCRQWLYNGEVACGAITVTTGLSKQVSACVQLTEDSSLKITEPNFNKRIRAPTFFISDILSYF